MCIVHRPPASRQGLARTTMYSCVRFTLAGTKSDCEGFIFRNSECLQGTQ